MLTRWTSASLVVLMICMQVELTKVTCKVFPFDLQGSLIFLNIWQWMFSQLNLYLFLCLAVSRSFIFYLLKIVISKQIFNRGRKGSILFFFFFNWVGLLFLRKWFSFWLHSFFVAVWRHSLVIESRGYSLLQCVGFSCRAQALGYGLSNCSTWA